MSLIIAQDKHIVIVGRKAICRAIGYNPREMHRLVEKDGLPAWQEGQNMKWRAICSELESWLKKRRKKYQKNIVK